MSPSGIPSASIVVHIQRFIQSESSLHKFSSLYPIYGRTETVQSAGNTGENSSVFSIIRMH